MKNQYRLLHITTPIIFTFAVNFNALAAPANTAAPLKLLTETKIAQPTTSIIQSKIIKRSRIAKVNFGLLGGEGSLASSKNQAQANTPKEITLNLFPGVSLIAVRDSLTPLSNGGYGWQGKVKSDGLSQITVVVHDGRITGDIRTQKGIYQIRPLPDGKHAISEINEQQFPDSQKDTIVPDGGENTTNTLQTSTDKNSPIDVMVAYTPAAATQAGGEEALQDLINATILGTNTIYQNSGITQRLRLVKTYQTTTNSSGNISTDLNKLTGKSDEVMDEIHTLRDSVGADLVSLWTEDSKFCSIGYLWSTDSSAFTVVSQNCASGNLSFAHAIGHNMGARHDWYVDSTIDNPTYNHGYINTTEKWRTVMSYNKLCADIGFNCPRIPYLSNPSISYKNIAIGAADGITTCTLGNQGNPVCDADNSRVHNDRALVVANFRQPVSKTPEAAAGRSRPPSNAPAAPTNLYGNTTSGTQINLSWTDNAYNETGFIIERCQGVGCTNFSPIGTSLANVANFSNTGLSAGTVYRYRVLATNGPSNSGYSNIITVQTTGGTPVSPPAAPINLTNNFVSNTQINIIWTDNANNETGFKIERCTGAGCTNFSQIGTSATNITYFVDTGLSPGTVYRYRLKSTNSAGDSGYSNTIDVTTTGTFIPASVPVAPSKLWGWFPGSYKVRLAWTDNSADETGFRVEYCQGFNCTNFTPLSTTTANAISTDISGLKGETFFVFRIQAFNATGNSGYSNTVTILTPKWLSN